MRTHAFLLPVLAAFAVCLPTSPALAQSRASSNPFRAAPGSAMIDLYQEAGGPQVFVAFEGDSPLIYRMVPRSGGRDEFSVQNLPIDSTLLTVTIAPDGIRLETVDEMRVEIINTSTRRVVAVHTLSAANERSVSIAMPASGSYRLLAWNDERASLHELLVPSGLMR